MEDLLQSDENASIMNVLVEKNNKHYLERGNSDNRIHSRTMADQGQAFSD